jgi:hypothetical protein
MTRVRCYAGASYPERPVAFEVEGRWLDVIEVVWQARTPEGSVFRVQAADGHRHRLVWDQVTDRWTISQENGE